MKLTIEYITSLNDQQLYELAKSKIYEDVPQEKEERFLFDIDDDISEYVFEVTDAVRKMYTDHGLSMLDNQVVYPELFVIKVWNDFVLDEFGKKFYYKRKIRKIDVVQLT